MSKIKFDGRRYLAQTSFDNTLWYPFWNDNDIPIDIKKSMSVNVEYEIDKEALFTNCGMTYIRGTTNCPCSGLWPDRKCSHCGGYGAGASFDKPRL